MAKKLIALIAVSLVLTGQAYAQITGEPAKDFDTSKSSFSLMDPDRLHIYHSYSLWYVSSKSGSQSLAMYLNSIEYQVSDPLTIRVDLGYLHRPGMFLKTSGGNFQEGQIFPALSINWQLSKNVNFHFDYRQVPYIYNYRLPGFYSPYERWEGR